MERVPACPDCGQPGHKLKDYEDTFSCECGSLWREVGWMKRVAAEKIKIDTSASLDGILSLLAIGEGRIKCDVCGKILHHAEKYCYDSNDEIRASDGYGDAGMRGRRYCKMCSIQKGYLRVAEIPKTGERMYNMLTIHGERPVPENEIPMYRENIKPCDGTLFCKFCGKPVFRLWITKEKRDYYILVCDNPKCVAFRVNAVHMASIKGKFNIETGEAL